MERRDFLTYSAGVALGVLVLVNTDAPLAAQVCNSALIMPEEYHFAQSNWITNRPRHLKTNYGKVMTGRVVALETGVPVPNTEVE